MTEQELIDLFATDLAVEKITGALRDMAVGRWVDNFDEVKELIESNKENILDLLLWDDVDYSAQYSHILPVIIANQKDYLNYRQNARDIVIELIHKPCCNLVSKSLIELGIDALDDVRFSRSLLGEIASSNNSSLATFLIDKNSGRLGSVFRQLKHLRQSTNRYARTYAQIDEMIDYTLTLMEKQKLNKCLNQNMSDDKPKDILPVIKNFKL